MKGLVSIIIVNWNGLSWLKMSLPSLAKQTYKPVEIILVDNASTDDSVSWTRKHFPNVKVLMNQENFGFAEGNNVGYREALGEYILLLNNDTRVKPDFLKELVAKMQSGRDIGAVQSKLLLMDDSKRLDSVGAFQTPTGFLFHWGFGKKDAPKYDRTEDMYTAKGAAVMFRTDVLKTVEMDHAMFDPLYFAYFEETDLCHRIWLSGKRVVYAPKSVVYHKMGGTSTGMDNAFIQYHSFKNRIRTYLKNMGWIWLMTLLPVHLVMCQLFAAASLTKGKFALWLSVQRSIWWNLVNIRDTLAKRRYIQSSLRMVQDSYIQSRVLRNPSMRYYISLSRGQSSDEA